MDNNQIQKLMLIIAVLGIIDTVYLTITHYTNTTVACPTVGIVNCENVLNSPYSTLIGIPLSLWGLFFFVIEIMLIFYTRGKDALLIYNGLGLGFVFYLLWIEYTLGSICIYCTAVHLFVLLLLILTILRR
jgi:uncharacterized membrane protein